MMAKILDFFRSIPSSVCFSISAYIFVAAFIVSLIVFFVFDIILNSFPIHLSWLFLLMGFYQRDSAWFKESGANRDSKTLIEDAKTLAIIVSMAALLNLFGVFTSIDTNQYNVFSLAMVLLYAGYILLCAGFGLSLLIRLMRQRPHAQLKKFSRYMYVIVAIVIILPLFIRVNSPTIIHVIGGIGALIGVVNTRGLSWFEGIAKDQKRDLVWSMMIISFSMIMIAIHYEQVTMKALHISTYFFEPLIASIGIWLFINALRLTFLSLYSLPTAHLMDKKSLELSTLAQLTSNAIQTQSIDAIISDTLKLLPKSIQAQGIYCRIHAFKTDHQRCEGQLGTELTILLSDPTFRMWISNSIEPRIVHELPIELNPNQILFTNSLLTIPLMQDGKSFGEIILSHTQPFHFTPEDASMLKVFAESIKIASDNVKLMSISKEHDRLENEMIIAKHVQKSLLPSTIFQPTSYSLSCFAISAKEVGGDFYDVFQLPNGNTCIIIADVSGKGIPAAFWMAMLRGAILSLQTENRDAKGMLISLQQMLASALESHMFITASCIIIEEQSNIIHFARAGHMPLIHFHDGKLNDYKPKGIGIGLTKDPAYFSHNLEDISVQLSEGDMCLLYTDGLIELFEEEHQFHEFCNEHSKDAHLFIQAIEALISGNTHTSLRDDVTVISFKRIQA